MKNIFKSSLKLIPIFLLLIIVGCEKDLYDEPIHQNYETKARLLTANEIRIIAEKLTKTIKKAHYIISNESQNRISITSIGTIKYDEVLQIIDDGKSTYTFKVDHPDSSMTKFYNLVYEEKANGDVVKLLEYTMTPEFAQLFYETFNYKDFKGTVSSYTIVNETPCPDEDLILINVGPVNDGGGGGGTGGGGTGGGSTGGGGTGGGSTGGGGTGDGGSIDSEPEAIVVIVNPEEEEWTEVSQSPRYFKMSVTQPNDISIIEDAPCNPNIQVGLLTPYTQCEKNFMQSSNQKLWLYQNQSSVIYSEIMQYVNGDGSGECDITRDQFVNEIIQQIIINPSIYTSIKPFLIEKQIDYSLLDPCSKGIFEQIKNTSNCDFAEVFSKIGADGTIYTTYIKTAPLPNGNSSPATTVKNSAYNYTIFISPNYTSKTKLFIAANLLHELVHAYFISIVDDYNSNPNNNQNMYNLNSFPSLFQAFCDKKFPPSNATAQNAHHSDMANFYVDAIARALQEFQTGIPVPDGAQPEQLYTDLAWGGLKDAPVFNDPNTYLTTEDRTRIINRYSCEGAGVPVEAGTPNEQNPVGQPCN